MFWCSNIQMFKHSNVQNVHMHRDSSGRGVRSNWWFWIGVCAALLVSAAATDQGTPLLGQILLLRLFSHLILFQEPVFRIIFYILLRAALCLCLQKNFFLGRDIRIFTWFIHRSMHVTLLFCVFHLNWGRGFVYATCLCSRHIFSHISFFCIKVYPLQEVALCLRLFCHRSKNTTTTSQPVELIFLYIFCFLKRC